MGRIVRAASSAPSSGAMAAVASDAAAAEVTLLLVSARAAAKEVALVLARKMAEKIVGRAVELDPAVMGDIAGQALAASRAREGAVVLRVHSADLAAVEQTRPGWRERLATAVAVRLQADDTVGRYGCIVETPVGRLDARLDTQLDALERALRGAGSSRA